MAVDTAAKRFSMLGFGDNAFGYLPTGTVDAEARASLLDLYEGIALGGITIGDPIYCDHYAFMSDADTAVVSAISAADVAIVAEIVDTIAVYAFMSDSDTVTVAEISDSDTVIVATIDC